MFALYVKFPKNRWKDIERAEKNDIEGNKIYNELKQEYLEKYMPQSRCRPTFGTPHKKIPEINENPYCIPTSKKDNECKNSQIFKSDGKIN